MWSETTSLEGAPPSVAKPHGWGLSVSRSGYFQMSAITTSLRTDLALDALNMGLWTRAHGGQAKRPGFLI